MSKKIILVGLFCATNSFFSMAQTSEKQKEIENSFRDLELQMEQMMQEAKEAFAEAQRISRDPDMLRKLDDKGNMKVYQDTINVSDIFGWFSDKLNQIPAPLRGDMTFPDREFSKQLPDLLLQGRDKLQELDIQEMERLFREHFPTPNAAPKQERGIRI
jgi:hypothetical protein